MKIVLAFAVGCYLLAAISLSIFQRELLYFPTPAVDHGLPQEWLLSDEQTLEIAVINPGREKAVLYFGGNAETVSNNAGTWPDALEHHTVYLMHYRGYGNSTGSPSEVALYSDALTLYDALEGRHQSVSAAGRSLGSGVALYLASQRKLRSLVLITPYDSIASVAQTHYPWFPVKALIRDKFDAAFYAASVKIPSKIMRAEHDKVIPAQHTNVLEKVLDHAQVWVAPNATHNTITSHPAFNDQLRQFLEIN
ncbi:MAG: alpha/beta hydrolase [Granulosicoccaceae bacterium]